VNVAQLSLDLPHRAALGAEDFLVSDCNLAAVRLIDAWPEWQGNVQLLIGPAASGKTHLARVWQARSGATAPSPHLLGIGAIDAMGDGTALVVEDIDRGHHNEKALFHLINLAREKGLFVLLTSREVPSRVDWTLPDLLSRLNALPPVQIGAPDEALLKAVMLKHFADRQLDVDPKVLDYLALHVDRSLDAAARAVEAVDRAALGSGRKISRQLAAEVLAAMAGEGALEGQNWPSP
jgi:chromosomal replication initiation ATPase DnaA